MKEGLPAPVPRRWTATVARTEERQRQQPPSSESDSELLRYWSVIRARVKLIAATTVVVTAAVAAGTLLQTPQYRATGAIEIRRPDAEVVPMDALFQQTRLSNQYLATQYEVLRSPTLARRVIADLGLASVEEFNPERDALNETAPVASAIQPQGALPEVVERFRKRLIVDPITGSYLIRVHFASADPQRAARVVNSVFAEYAELRQEAGMTAVSRLAEQTENARVQLTAAERRLDDYKRANGLLFIDNGSDRAESIPNERLRRLQQELVAAEADRYGKEALHNLLRTEGDSALDGEVLRALVTRIAELRGEYAKLRSTFTDQYPRAREVRRQLDELEVQLAGERERVGSAITRDYHTALRRETLLRSAVDEQKAVIDRASDRATEYRVLEREVAGHQQLYALLQQRFREAEVSAALASTEFQVVDPATAPNAPFKPDLGVNIMLALLSGVVLGLGLAFLREHLDPRVRTIEEIDALAVPVLGMIPTATHAISTADAFAGLRTSVLLETAHRGVRSLVVSSAQPGAGKSTTSANLAVSLGRLGKRVLLVDADSRRPVLHTVFNVDLSPGLMEYLAGDDDTASAVHAPWLSNVLTDVAPRVDFLPAGRVPAAPTELLASDRMRKLVNEAEGVYDFVLFDSPALFINAADSRILAPLVDGVVVVVRSGVTAREALRRALRQVPNLTGVVLNDVDSRYFPAYYGSYEHPLTQTSNANGVGVS